jgi:hypothetical protein
VRLSVYSGASATGTPAVTSVAAVTAGRWTAAVPELQDGTWTVVVTQTDDAGHTGTSGARTFLVDYTLPAVTLSVPRYVRTPGLSGSAGTASGDDTGVSVTIAGIGSQGDFRGADDRRLRAHLVLDPTSRRHVHRLRGPEGPPQRVVGDVRGHRRDGERR